MSPEPICQLPPDVVDAMDTDPAPMPTPRQQACPPTVSTKLVIPDPLEAFPPLPRPIQNGEKTIQMPCLGKVRLALGPTQPKEGDNPKRTQPPSPTKDCTPKRHTSLGALPTSASVLSPREQPRVPVPPITPTPRSGNQTLPQSQAMGAKNLSENVRVFTFTSPSQTTIPGPDSPLLEGSDSLELSRTAIGDPDWDDVLAYSPPQPSTTTEVKDKNPSHTDAHLPSPVHLRASSLPHVTNIHHDIKTQDNVTTNSTGLQRTAIPNGGWPKVHLGSTPLDNVAPLQAEAWKKVATIKLWARLFRGKYEPNSLATVDKTRALIKGLIKIDDDLSLGVSFPLQEKQVDAERFPPPYNMLISGLTSDQLDHLLSLEVVSTKEITILFRPFTDPRPSFVMTICGLTYQASEAARTAVTDLVRSCIKDSEDIIKHIVDCAPMLKDRVTRDIFDNIYVKFIEVKRSSVSSGDF